MCQNRDHGKPKVAVEEEDQIEDGEMVCRGMEKACLNSREWNKMAEWRIVERAEKVHSCPHPKRIKLQKKGDYYVLSKIK